MPEYMSDNIRTEIINGVLHYCDTVEEKISPSDRFKLWLSPHPQDIDSCFDVIDVIDVIDAYFTNFDGNQDELDTAAKLFAAARGFRSERTTK
jgi:predicted AAA+ superfamily ATPase